MNNKSNQTHVDELVSLRDVAAEYKRPSYWSWLRMAHAGELPVVRLPSAASKSGRHGQILVRRSDVESLINRSRNGD